MEKRKIKLKKIKNPKSIGENWYGQIIIFYYSDHIQNNNHFPYKFNWWPPFPISIHNARKVWLQLLATFIVTFSHKGEKSSQANPSKEEAKEAILFKDLKSVISFYLAIVIFFPHNNISMKMNISI